LRKADRVVAEEPSDHRIIIAGLHIGQARGPVSHMAGEAALVEVQAGCARAFAERGEPLGPADRAGAARGGNRGAQMVAMDIVRAGIEHPHQRLAAKAERNVADLLSCCDILPEQQLARQAVDRVNRLAIDDLFNALVITIIDEAAGCAPAGHGRGLVGAVIDIDEPAIADDIAATIMCIGALRA